MKRQQHSETISHIFKGISESNARYARLIHKHNPAWVDLKKNLLTKEGEIQIARVLRPHIFFTEPKQWAKRCFDEHKLYLGVNLNACLDLIHRLSDKEFLSIDGTDVTVMAELKLFEHNYYPNGLVEEQDGRFKLTDASVEKYFFKSIPYQALYLYEIKLCEDPVFLDYLGCFAEMDCFLDMRFVKDPFNTLGRKRLAIPLIAEQLFDESARLLLIMNQRYVVSLTRKYRNRGVEFSDLIMEGVLGFLQGIRRYDPERGVRVTTFVHWSIKQFASRAAATGDRLIYVPFHITEVMNKIATIRTKLRSEGVIPTNEEILFHLLNDRLKHIPQNLINTLDEVSPYAAGGLAEWRKMSIVHEHTYKKVICMFLAWLDSVKAFNLPYIEISDNPEAINFTGDVGNIDKVEVFQQTLNGIQVWLDQRLCANAGRAYLEFMSRSKKRVTTTLKNQINKEFKLDKIKIDQILSYVDEHRDEIKSQFNTIADYL
jgi:RNA polymerase sigma factor (sigma-70 family)